MALPKWRTWQLSGTNKKVTRKGTENGTRVEALKHFGLDSRHIELVKCVKTTDVQSKRTSRKMPG